MKAIHRKRLLNVARALRESKAPDKFEMSRFGHEGCGTPACALGHYAARRDLQKTFRLKRFAKSICYTGRRVWIADNGGRSVAYDCELALDHFGIDFYEAEELFGSRGCEEAPTATDAADYIERFVARKAKS